VEEGGFLVLHVKYLEPRFRIARHNQQCIDTLPGSTVKRRGWSVKGGTATMKRIKGVILGLVIGLALGLWFGFNMGSDRPLLSNPFEEAAFQEKIKETGGSLMEKGGEALERGGQALKQQSQEDEPLAIPEEYRRQ
jgi:hypothetical protein